jgi:hypothetical protein
LASRLGDKLLWGRAVREILAQRRFDVGLDAFRLIGRRISFDWHTVLTSQKLREIPFDRFDPQYARELEATRRGKRTARLPYRAK